MLVADRQTDKLSVFSFYLAWGGKKINIKHRRDEGSALTLQSSIMRTVAPLALTDRAVSALPAPTTVTMLVPARQ